MQEKGPFSWNTVGWLCVGVIPAALVGARVNVALPAGVLTVILAVLIVLSGINALLKNPVTIKSDF